MKAKKFSEAMGNVRDEYVSEAIAYQRKRKNHSWLKWTAMAACLCLMLCAIIIPQMSKQELPNELIGVPHVQTDETIYLRTPCNISFESCPDGFEYGGIVKNGHAKDYSYFVNDSIPEWIYVLEETKQSGTNDAFVSAYVRYVDSKIRGKDFVRYNDTLYISMYSANNTEGIDEAMYSRIKDSYGMRIETLTAEEFSYVGTTVFEGYDTIPCHNFGSNTHCQEQKIYANKENADVLLVSATWNTSSESNQSIENKGFLVYIPFEYKETTHDNAEVINFDGTFFSVADISQETIKWLEWYNALSDEEKLATSDIPHELINDIKFEAEEIGE